MWSAVFRRSGPVRQVLPATQEGLGIYQDLGNRDDQITALNEAGALSRTRGDLGRAWSCHQQALDLARQIGSPLEEAHAAGRPGPCARPAAAPPRPKTGCGRRWRSSSASGRPEPPTGPPSWTRCRVQVLRASQGKQPHESASADAVGFLFGSPGGGRLCGTYLDQSPARDAMDAGDRAITTGAFIHPTLRATPDCVSLQAGRLIRRDELSIFPWAEMGVDLRDGNGPGHRRHADGMSGVSFRQFLCLAEAREHRREAVGLSFNLSSLCRC